MDLYAETFEELHGEKLEDEVKPRSLGKVLVIGSRDGDIDSLASAIALADIKNSVDMSRKYIPYVAGELDDTAEFALEYFEYPTPECIDTVKPTDAIMLVGHNEKAKAIEGAEGANITELIDNHALNSLKTKGPLYVRCEPRGATATIVYSIIKEEEEGVNKKIAGLLCAAIIHKTEMFQSESTTQADKIAAMELANLAGLDLADFSKKLNNLNL